MKSKLEVSYIPIGDIIPYAQNARKHSEKQIGQIANSLTEFGFMSPVLVDKDGNLIAGHGRLLAAERIGLDFVPAIRFEDLTPQQVRAYRLADNKLAENAEWDQDLLRVEIEYLTNVDIDFDVSLIGFSTTEVDLILESDAIPDTDDEVIPPPSPDCAVSRLGDIWILRTHRVIVGDCRHADTIDALMGGAQAQMILSDAPYNVPISGHVSGLGRTRHREFPMASGEMSAEEFTRFLTDSFGQFARVSVDGSLHYLFMDWRHLKEILHAGEAVYDRLVNLITWVKDNAGMGSLYRSQHELVLVFKKGSSVPHINNVELGRNGRYRTNVWSYAGVNSFGADRDESLAWHPTVKPVQLLADAILDVTHRGDIVLDGFLGSGSTLIAAERTGRVCYGVEIDPGYVDVTIQRWEATSGERATLVGTDLNIDQIAAERSIQREVVA